MLEKSRRTRVTPGRLSGPEDAGKAVRAGKGRLGPPLQSARHVGYFRPVLASKWDAWDFWQAFS